MGADGQPQSSLVWVDYDGACARTDTTLERQKGRNMQANPKVSLLVVDPDNTGRFLQIRGDADLVTDGALEQLDALTRKYTGHPRYYGFIYPADQQARETRVIVRLQRAKGHARCDPCLRTMGEATAEDGASLETVRARYVLVKVHPFAPQSIAGGLDAVMDPNWPSSPIL